MIAIIDYGAGNLGSVTKAFDALAADYRVVDSGLALEALKPSGIVLPGVGAFGTAVEKLKNSGFFPILKEYISQQVPFLGICLGMQLLMENSLEAPAVTGLGIFPGTCQRFNQGKVPQIGWNRIQIIGEPRLFKDVPKDSFFYFIHSYYVDLPETQAKATAALTTYYRPFVSALEWGNLCALQFHPEKSGEPGLLVLRNWLNGVAEAAPELSTTSGKTIRIIPCLDVDNGRVVKGVQFENIRDAGDPVQLAKQYNRDGADEITFLDIGATYKSREILLDVVQQVSRQVFVPLAVGGGITSVQDMRQVLNAGADKVSICSAAIGNPDLLSQGARQFGSQCILLSIDAGRIGDHWHAFLNGGRVDSGLDVVEWAIRAQKLGAGEILLNAINRDGTREGYDLDLTARVAQAVSIPVIASGGAGTLEHLADAIHIGKADAILLASLLHDNQLNLMEIKTYLKRKGVIVRW